jgi:hypothetical protein
MARYLCATHGDVEPVAGKAKDATRQTKRMSGGKITAGVLTGGISLLATGLRSKKAVKATILVCPVCKREVIAV